MSVFFNPITFAKRKIACVRSKIVHEVRDYSQVISFCVSPAPFDVSGHIDADDLQLNKA